jgi:hypothetical protein
MNCECSVLGNMAPCSWCTDPMRVFDDHYIDTAQGEELDKIAKTLGLVRHSETWYSGGSETDVALRDRIYDYCGVDNPSNKPQTKNKCECGAHKLGYIEKGIGHSSWCPIS